jgi:CheY-like chemotaxis protein
VWFALALVVFLLLYPTLKGIIRTRPFTIKVGSMELNVQQASDQLQRQVEDLQDQVAGLRLQANPKLAGPQLATDRPIVVWADDNPANNAYETAKLQKDGVQVVEARSTAEAMKTIESGRPPVDLVITDLGRVENGTFVGDAGLQLCRQARKIGFDKPIYVYSTRAASEQREPEVKAAGGTGITSSPVELLTILKTGTR